MTLCWPRGAGEPDPQQDRLISLDGTPVAVPQGRPVPQADSQSSSFDQSEYLVYQEGQQRLRYILTFQW